jgi:hypothetical protein
VRTLAQVRDVLTARYDVARFRPNDSVRTVQTSAAANAPSTPRAPGLAGAPLNLTTFVHATTAAAPARTPATPAMTVAQAAPDTAGMTSAFAAAAPTPIVQQSNQVFHGLFQDTDRAAPVAAVVSQLWTTPNALPETTGDSAPPPRRDLRSLFSDPGDKS